MTIYCLFRRPPSGSPCSHSRKKILIALAVSKKLPLSAGHCTFASKLLPLDKPLDSEAVEVFDQFDPAVIASIIANAGSIYLDKVVSAYTSRFPGKKGIAFKVALEKVQETHPTRIDEAGISKASLTLHVTEDQAYFQIFATTLSGFFTLPGNYSPPPINPRFDELGFGPDYFVIRGYLPIPQVDGTDLKIFFLNIGIRSNRGVYLIKYLIPGSGNLKDIRNAQWLVHSFHIIQ